MNISFIRILNIIFTLLILSSCNGRINRGDIETVAADIDNLYAEIDTLFSRYVTFDRGLVDYNSIWNDSLFQTVASTVETFDMGELITSQDSLAFWINAYNIMVINTIREWGVETSQEELGFPLFKKKINIAGEFLSLDELEKTDGKYIKKFNDPRTHFALVCAAMSCPPLLNKAYRSDSLYFLLDKKAEDFFNDTLFNKFDTSGAKVTPLINWYSYDFLGKVRDTSTIIMLYDSVGTSEKDFISGYLNSLEKREALSKHSLEFNNYDWTINKQ